MRFLLRARVLLLSVGLVAGIEAGGYAQELTFESVAVVAVAPSEQEMAIASAIGKSVIARLRESKVQVSREVTQLQMDRVSAAGKLSTIANEQKVEQVAVVSYRRTNKDGNEGLASVIVAGGVKVAKDLSDAVVVAMERVSEGATAALDWVAKQAAEGVRAVASRGQLVAIRLYVRTTPGEVTFTVGHSSPGVTDPDGLAIWSATQRPGTVPVDFWKSGYRGQHKELKVPAAKTPLTFTISADLLQEKH